MHGLLTSSSDLFTFVFDHLSFFHCSNINHNVYLNLCTTFLREFHVKAIGFLKKFRNQELSTFYVDFRLEQKSGNLVHFSKLSSSQQTITGNQIVSIILFDFWFVDSDFGPYPTLSPTPPLPPPPRLSPHAQELARRRLCLFLLHHREYVSRSSSIQCVVRKCLRIVS